MQNLFLKLTFKRLLSFLLLVVSLFILIYWAFLDFNDSETKPLNKENQSLNDVSSLLREEEKKEKISFEYYKSSQISNDGKIIYLDKIEDPKTIDKEALFIKLLYKESNTVFPFLEKEYQEQELVRYSRFISTVDPEIKKHIQDLPIRDQARILKEDQIFEISFTQDHEIFIKRLFSKGKIIIKEWVYNSSQLNKIIEHEYKKTPPYFRFKEIHMDKENQLEYYVIIDYKKDENNQLIRKILNPKTNKFIE